MDYVVLLGVTMSCVGQGVSAEPAEAGKVKAWLEVCTAHAQDYEICVTEKPQQKFKLLPTPIFRHGQPARGGGDIGAVWLWVRPDGRPAAVGTVFCYVAGGDYRSMAHEFHSLIDEPLTAVWRGRQQWSPATGGVGWKPIPKAPQPAESAAARLRQIRSLARRFGGHSIAHDGNRWELRLIPRPVYRYQIQDPGPTLDGALMALCQGTDPEIMLSIEARKTEDGYRWHYACAAFSDYKLHARLDNAEVWAPATERYNNRTAPHWWNGAIERIMLPEKHSPQE